jgi:NitT/TauT family transport system ATP-binding protein
VSFAVRPGEFLSVIGPSGCGKSTLFNIIGGLLAGYEGRVSVGSMIIRGPHPRIGMVFQEESTFPVAHRASRTSRFRSRSPACRSASARARRHFIALVGLDGFERRYPPSCPAACASASPSRARSRRSRASC